MRACVRACVRVCVWRGVCVCDLSALFLFRSVSQQAYLKGKF